jgi:hypothetical protein
MTTPVRDEGARIRDAVTGAVERVFDTVATVHAVALRCCGQATAESAIPSETAFADLEEAIREELTAPGQLAVGLGLIVVPAPDRQLPLRLEWWQVDSGSDQLVALDADLRPNSVGFYDYASADWFDVPRRTGRRHVVGPYVDVHGTGRYLLTLTAPVAVAGGFLGVVGADVPVSRFENHVLRTLGPLDNAFVIVNGENRVVLSTVPQWPTGSLLAGAPGSRDDGEFLPHLPWRLRVLPRHDSF